MSRLSSLSYAASASSSAVETKADSAPDAGQEEMTISQMSRLYGVSLRTLRFYEDRGLIKPRREGNARYYRAADRVRYGHDSPRQKARLHPLRNQRPDRRQGRQRNARPRGALATAADRQPDRPPRAAARGNRQARSPGCARRTIACPATPPPEPRGPGAPRPGPPYAPTRARLDDPLRLGECGLDAQVGRVEPDGVVRGPQRRRRTPGIARVALQDVGQNGVVVRPFAAMREFERAPLGAGCGAGGHEDLHVRVRGDDRADVAAVENRASRPGSEGALRLEQRLANARAWRRSPKPPRPSRGCAARPRRNR